MSFAQEIKDFTSAFTAVSSVLGTRESREAERLDNEYRRATIDLTRARIAEIGAQGQDLTDYLTTTTYDPAPLDTTSDGTDITTPASEIAAKSDQLRSGWLTETGLGVPARTGAGAGTVVPTPTRPAARTATGATVPTPRGRAAAVDDSDLAGATGGTAGTGTPRADVLAGGYDVRIKDRTSMRGVQPKTYNSLNHANAAAKQMGVRLVVTAGAGGGHRSHGSGTELDVIGYHADGSKWTTAERAKVALAGGRVGANRFGLYPGMSLHIGTAGGGRPSAMWGAGGLVRGDASRQFTDPADRAFYQAFANGKIFGNSGPASFDASMASSNYRSPLERARNAIRFMESSGNYGTNTGNGALGAYQVMARNLPSWSREAFGREVSAKEFLANPQLQDQLFDHKFGQYFQKYGNLQDAASAWFTGRPLAGGGAGASDGNITGQQYVARFNKNLGLPETQVTTGGAGATGRGAGAIEDIEYDTFAKDDQLPAYPSSAPAAEPNPMASSTDATMMDTGTGSTSKLAEEPAAAPELIHTVEPGETLTSIADKYNLDTYMALVEANPQIKDPDKIAVGEKLVVPGQGGAVADAGVPNPRPRPVTLESYTPFEQEDAPAGLRYNPRPEGSLVAGRPDVPVGALPAGEQPALPDYSNFELPPPSPETVWDERAEARIREERLRDEASRQGEAVSQPNSARFREVMALGANEEPISSADPESLNAAGMTPPTPERGPVERDKLSGQDSSDTMKGGPAVDELGPAQTSIAEVTNSWNVTDDGHVITPEGQKSSNDTFKSGRNAAKAGSNWLARNFFPGADNDAVDLAEDVAPDDGSDTAADRYLSGAYAVKKSDMQKIHDVVDAWAQRHGITLTESERNMRSLGIMFDYWMTRGEPEKAQAVAGGMLQYYRVRYGQYSAIAKAALGKGNTEKAVEAAVKAYAQIPDGRDITVEGNAEDGWTFSYVNEETGKRISQKVLSPQEVQGMILSMEPGDVDKFLVKAAGEDELPEPSAAFTAAIDALNATPPGEKPVYDANAMAYFDSGEASIYGNAFSQKMDEWQQGAAMRDYERFAGVAPPTSVAAPPAGGGTAVTTPPAGGGTAVTPPAAPPAAGGAAVPGVGEAPLPGGARQIAPRVYTPGTDGTFGLGDFEQLNLVPTETTFGLEWQKLNYENRKEVYQRELARRDHSYQRWVLAHEMLAPPEPEKNPMTISTGEGPLAPEPYVGAGLSSGAVQSEPGDPRLAAFGDRAERLAGAVLPTVKGPKENWGIGPRPEADENIVAVLTDDALRTSYETRITKRQTAWDAAKDLIQADWNAQTEIPKPSTWSVEDTTGVADALEKFPEGFGFSEEELEGVDEGMTNFVRDNANGLKTLAMRIGTQNNLNDPQLALSTALGLTMPDKERLGSPPFVAVEHPARAGTFIVQPLEIDDNMSGSPLIMQRSDLDLVLDMWNRERFRLSQSMAPQQHPGAPQVDPRRIDSTGVELPAVGALDIEAHIPEGGAAPGLAPMEPPVISNPTPAAENDPNRIPGSRYTQEQIDQMSADPAIREWARRQQLEKDRANANQPGAGALDLFDPYADVPGYPSPIYNR